MNLRHLEPSLEIFFCSRVVATVVFCFFFVCQHCQAASFDCSVASRQIDKMICGTATVSKLDDDLAAIYIKSIAQVKAPMKLKEQQRLWIAGVRNRCGNTECLQHAYSARIAQIDFLPLAPEIALTAEKSSDIDACHAVAHYANLGKVGSLTVDFLSTTKDEKDLRQIFGEDAWLYGGLSYWHVDLNNDGVLDHLVVETDGTMRVSRAYVRSGNKGATVDSIDDSETGNIDVNVLAVGGRYYVLSGYGESLSKLWRINKDGVVHQICRFTARKEPSVQQTVGQRNPVCEKVRQNKIEHADFLLIHALGRLQTEDRFWSMTAIDGLTKMDIDNDGKVDNVVRIDLTHGAGRGCSTTYLAVANAGRTRLPDSKLNNLLLGELGGRCGPTQSVFSLDGVAYIDTQSGEGNRIVYAVKRDKLEVICNFQSRVLFDAVTAE